MPMYATNIRTMVRRKMYRYDTNICAVLYCGRPIQCPGMTKTLICMGQQKNC